MAWGTKIMRKIALLAFLAFIPLFSLNMFEAYRDGEQIDLVRLLLELLDTGLVVFAISAAAYMMLEVREFAQERALLGMELAQSRSQGEKWRNEAQSYVTGLGQAMRRQMHEWGLSDSEADIALLMLKGLSHRDIAQIRKTSEITVRQQAQAIYAKSKLRNRTELSAYFLEDITAPMDPSKRSEENGVSSLRTGRAHA